MSEVDTMLDAACAPPVSAPANFEEAKARCEGLKRYDEAAEEVARWCAAGDFGPVKRDTLKNIIADRSKVARKTLDQVMATVERDAKARQEAAEQAQTDADRTAMGEASGGQDRGPKLPWYIQAGEDGKVYRLEGGEGSRDEVDPVFLTNPVEVLGQARDENEVGWGTLTRFDNRDGLPHETFINESDLRDAPSLVAKFRSEGLDVDQSANGAAAFRQYLQALQRACPDRIRDINQPGLHRKVGVFMAPSGEAVEIPAEGDAGKRNVFRLKPSMIADNPEPKGSREEWEALIERVAVAPGNLHWKLGILTGFVGATLQFAGLKSCGLNFAGTSSQGKSIAMALGASVWGDTDEGKHCFHNANSTKVGFSGLLVKMTGSLLALDELKLAAKAEIIDLAYMISAEGGKSKGTVTGELAKTASHTAFVTMSVEQGLPKLFAEQGATYLAGTAVRVPEFDTTPDHRSDGRFAGELEDGLKAHHGHAGVAYVRHLVACGYGTAKGQQRLSDEVRECARRIARGDGEADPAGTAERAARVFGLLLRAGELAQEAGIITRKLDVAGVVAKAWGTFIASAAGAVLDPAESVVQELLHVWATRKDVLIPHDESEQARRKEAWAFSDEKKGLLYIPQANLLRVFGTTYTESQVVQALESRELLVLPTGRRGKVHQRMPGVGAEDANLPHYRLNLLKALGVTTIRRNEVKWERIDSIRRLRDTLPFRRAFDAARAAEAGVPESLRYLVWRDERGFYPIGYHLARHTGSAGWLAVDSGEFGWRFDRWEKVAELYLRYLHATAMRPEEAFKIEPIGPGAGVAGLGVFDPREFVWFERAAGERLWVDGVSEFAEWALGAEIVGAVPELAEMVEGWAE